MRARFLFTSSGWYCSHTTDLEWLPNVVSYKHAKILWLNVSKQPPVHRFCKRPHYYL